MILSGIININQCLIIKRTSPHLIITARQQLDHIIPVILILRLQITQADFLQLGDNCFHKCACSGCHVVAAKIVHRKRFAGDFVHRAGWIGDGRYFISIIFFPPVERCGHIDWDKYLAQKFAVVAACFAEAFRKVEIVRSQFIFAILIIKAVHPSPAVHRIAGTAHGIFQIHDAGTF